MQTGADVVPDFNFFFMTSGIVRRLDSSPSAFLVTLTIQKLSNAKNNLNKATAAAAIPLPGWTPSPKLTARSQGSVYVVRNDSANGTVTVYQLDTWHQATHPMRWPADVVDIEAEMFEGHLGKDAAGAIVTEFPPGNDGHDWTQFTTFVDLARAATAPDGAAGVRHQVQHDGDGSCSAVRVRARSGLVLFRFDPVGEAGQAVKAAPLASEILTADGDSWQWLRVTAPAGANCHRFRLHGTADVDRVGLVLA